MTPGAVARLVAAGLLGGVYVLGSHWLMTGAHESPWNAVGVLAPMLAAVAVGAWRGGQRLLGAMAAALIAGLCLQALLGVHTSAQVLYVAQHVGINLFLAALFGSTLRAGHTPLITTLAKRVNRVFTPELKVYTRHVTEAWTAYFVGMAGLSLMLYGLAPFNTWAVFANLLTPLAVGLMFVGEHVVRYWLHPEFERVSMAAAARAYQQTSQVPGRSDKAA